MATHDKINDVSSRAVEKATSRGWDQWIAFIDERGGAQMEHKAIVALLAAEGGVEKGWWQQKVTVGYEHARGRRETGQTRDAGYQIGVQKAIPRGATALWDLLTSEAGTRTWLGAVGPLSFAPGERFAAGELSGEIRAVYPGHKLRLTWQPPGRAHPTTLQLSLSCPRKTSARTTLRFHHEKLADMAERERMRAHWRAVLEALSELARIS